MCIAIASFKGVEIPNKQRLRNCFNRNSDGAGFSIATGKEVIISKGYMTFDDFEKAIDKYSKLYDLKESGVLIHFRIKTHGKVSKEQTHPFPISSLDIDLNATDISVDRAMVHNGIIRGYGSYSLSSKLSDTQEFCKEFLYHFEQANKEWWNSAPLVEIVTEELGSKMAILDKSGEIKTFGTGWIQDKEDHVWYSNSNYTASSYCGYGSYNSYNKNTKTKEKDKVAKVENGWDWYKDKVLNGNDTYQKDDFGTVIKGEKFCYLCEIRGEENRKLYKKEGKVEVLISEGTDYTCYLPAISPAGLVYIYDFKARMYVLRTDIVVRTPKKDLYPFNWDGIAWERVDTILTDVKKYS